MVYVDGFVIPMPKKSVKAYRRMATQGGKVWKKYGALEFRECLADELVVTDPHGKKVSPFAKMTKLKRGETLAFSWIVYKSKAHRNRVNAKVMKDPVILKSMENMIPFDMKRMAYGGFKTIVDL